MPGALAQKSWLTELREATFRSMTQPLLARAPDPSKPPVPAPEPQQPQPFVSSIPDPNQYLARFGEGMSSAGTAVAGAASQASEAVSSLIPDAGSYLSRFGFAPEPPSAPLTTTAPATAISTAPAVPGQPSRNGGVTSPAGVAPTQGVAPSQASQQPSQAEPLENVGTDDKADPERYYRAAMPIALQVEQETGVPAALMVAIGANETGFGQRRYMAGPNNYHGLQADPNDPNGVPYVDWRPGPNGEQIRYAARQQQFATPLDGFRGFARTLTNSPRYQPALARYQQTKDIDRLVADIHRAGYAEDPEYTTKITSLIRGIPHPTGAGHEVDRTGVPITQRVPGQPAAPAQPAAQQQPPAAGGFDVNDVATRYGGGSYVFGGGRDQRGLGIPGARDTDCSAFVSSVWQEQGIALPAHTDAAYSTLTNLGAARVSAQDARPGDVVFYMGSGYGGAVTYHMGIYAGNGQILDSSRSGQGQGVMVRPMGHAGSDIVILRDPRVNGRTDPRRSAAPPPIEPSGLAESPQGQQIVARAEQQQAPSSLPPTVAQRWRSQFGREPTPEEQQELMGVIGGFA